MTSDTTDKTKSLSHFFDLVAAPEVFDNLLGSRLPAMSILNLLCAVPSLADGRPSSELAPLLQRAAAEELQAGLDMFNEGVAPGPPHVPGDFSYFQHSMQPLNLFLETLVPALAARLTAVGEHLTGMARPWASTEPTFDIPSSTNLVTLVQ